MKSRKQGAALGGSQLNFWPERKHIVQPPTHTLIAAHSRMVRPKLYFGTLTHQYSNQRLPK